MSDTASLQVKIRTSEDVKSVDLMRVPSDTDPERVIGLVGRWGVDTEYGTYHTNDLSGQFVFRDGEAFFEIVVELEE